MRRWLLTHRRGTKTQRMFDRWLAKLCWFAAVLVVLLSADTAAEPAPSHHLRMRDPSTLTVSNGKTYELPPGRFLSEPFFEKKDQELRRLQELETRLTAERDEYRRQATTWRPGWKTAGTAFLLGIAGAVFAFTR